MPTVNALGRSLAFMENWYLILSKSEIDKEINGVS